MPTFEVYVDDDRYQVPSLYLITATDEAGARNTADQMLRSSNHHRGVEVRREGERLYACGSLGQSAGARRA